MPNAEMHAAAARLLSYAAAEMMRYHRIASNVALALASPKSSHRRASPFLPRPSLVRMSSSGGAADTGAGTTCVERTVTCSDGISLSARCWEAPPSAVASSEPNNRTKKKILCLHGWLDNSASGRLFPAKIAVSRPPKSGTCWRGGGGRSCGAAPTPRTAPEASSIYYSIALNRQRSRRTASL